MEDARANRATDDYDSMDCLVTRSDPLSRSESFEYDAGGRIKAFTHASANRVTALGCRTARSGTR